MYVHVYTSYKNCEENFIRTSVIHSKFYTVYYGCDAIKIANSRQMSSVLLYCISETMDSICKKLTTGVIPKKYCYIKGNIHRIQSNN